MLAGQKIGLFAIEKELGSGAMGTVYRARYTEDDRVVALKVIAFGLAGNDGALARFEREAGILKQLKHPNIVRLFATGKWRGTPFFAMEYVDGESLDRVMARRDRFTWQEVVTIGKQLCSALQHAHEKGIIHRDLKPSNLMVTRDGTVKLTDFGIAKDIDVTALTGANNTIGTAAYMSPEQCKGEKSLTGKSDLYSLGVVFFELLSGHKPFIADSSVDMFLMHVNEQAPRIRGQPACLDVPQGLDTLVHQLMEKKPDHRPRDAAMVVQALEEIEQKEIARIGRGEEVAKARIIDGVETAPMNEADKEIAKNIRAGTKKKKPKKQQKVPFFRQGWFVIVGSVAIVLSMAFIAWLLLRPDSPDEMLAHVKGAKTTEVKLAAAKRYLDAYGKNPKYADKTEEVQNIYREVKVLQREMVLLKRHGKPNLRTNVEEGDDPEAYRKSMEGLTAEEDGDVARARKNWNEIVEKFPKDASEEKALWGWIAAKRLRDLKQVDENEKKALRVIASAEENETDIKIDDEHLAGAVEAERFTRFDDNDRARERWDRMARELKPKVDQRNWYLLAGKKVRELAAAKKMLPDERKKMLQDRLKAAQEKADDAKRTGDQVTASVARQIAREIRDLYDEPLFKDEVQKAQTLLEKARP